MPADADDDSFDVNDLLGQLSDGSDDSFEGSQPGSAPPLPPPAAVPEADDSDQSEVDS
ncbi:unnamed protein product, partial [Polarella glacialis]